MKLLWDTDVVEKLAEMDLLSQALDAAELGKDDSYILEETRVRFQLDHPTAGKKRHGDRFERVKAFVGDSRVKQYTSDDFPSDKALEHLSRESPDIDPGEAILFLMGRRWPTSCVFTGDKRSLVALSKHANLAQLLKGRCMCFEQMLLRLINKVGIAKVAAAAAHSNDALVKAIFKKGAATTEKHAVKRLTAAVDKLRNELAVPLLVAE